MISDEFYMTLLKKRGVTGADALMLLDIAKHASIEAIQTAVRITDAAPTKGEVALLVAAMMMADHLNTAAMNTVKDMQDLKAGLDKGMSRG